MNECIVTESQVRTCALICNPWQRVTDDAISGR